MHIHSLDLAIVIVYLLAVTALGMRFRRKQSQAAPTAGDDRNAVTREYFLGGRNAPWWALALSIVATETSTLTIIGTPAIAYSTNPGNLRRSCEVAQLRDALVVAILGVMRMHADGRVEQDEITDPGSSAGARRRGRCTDRAWARAVRSAAQATPCARHRIAR